MTSSHLGSGVVDHEHATLGAVHLGGGRTRFRVWAPNAARVEVRLVTPGERRVALDAEADGYHAGVGDAPPGSRYFYVLDGKIERPDPASRLQPEGVHGPSEVVDVGARGAWRGIALEDYVTYEIHVGTFTPEGTFDAAIGRLDDLRELGVTAIEVMPVAAFPGAHNWGYDGAYPFAVAACYGGPAGLARFVEACHARELAVVLDVVPNHLGPEGTYLADFGPYFATHHHTPWGRALNFDGAHSDEVRRFFIESALWFTVDLGVDALRLDAVKAIVDNAARSFLEELGEAVHAHARERGRAAHLFAESDANDPRLFAPIARGGVGLDGAWSEDFHHALHARLTGERAGYYQDFGRIEHLAKCFREGFAYTGERSRFRKKRHGRAAPGLEARRLVVFAQNHDQVGNRPGGERLASLVSFEAQKLAAGATLLSPFAPLIFMGEEHAETAPFFFFTSHGDPGLGAAVARGRRKELADFGFSGKPPDPQAEATFTRSKIDWDLRGRGEHATMRALYRELLRLRREVPALSRGGLDAIEVRAFEDEGVLYVRRWHDGSEVALVLAFANAPVTLTLPLPPGRWRPLLATADARWGGPGAALGEIAAPLGGARVELAPSSCTLLVAGQAGGLSSPP